MKINRYLIASIASALVASAWAQSVPQTLNLKLPPSNVTAGPTVVPAKDANKAAAGAVATTAATTTTAVAPASQPPAQSNAQYDANANAIVDAADSAHASVDTADSSHTPADCDDAAYNQTQVHGSMGMGVVAGNHVSGNFQTGSVNISKALGSCAHPAGGMSLSIDVGQGNFNGGNYAQRHW
jgi:hypothetical protein